MILQENVIQDLEKIKNKNNNKDIFTIKLQQKNF